MAQNKVTLSGKVKDQHGTPIAQATIAVENTTSGTYTDDRGKYSLQVAPGKHTFVVSFLGYQTVKQSLDIRQDKKQNFTLQESAVTLSSVEVYGKTQTQKVKEGAFSVNALDIKPIVNSLNNLNDLVNRTTGIKVREEGGVGSDFDLSINGMSGNSVRYFLDGMPLDTKGSGVSLANLPINIIDRIEIYKGVVPASLGTDALGGAINIITKQEKKDYLDVSYGIGSFHTHKADLNAQFVEKKNGLIVRPTVGINYSKNDYRMKNVQMRDESGDNFIYGNPKRFHDGYFSLLAQVEAGFVNKSWADAFFVSASYSKTDKELQTGSVQNKVYGMAERNSDSWNISARYQKYNFILKNMQLNASLSHTWDHSLTVDTAYRKYYWDGGYIVSQRNEIMGKEPSMRHYKRPLTIMRTNLDYQLNTHHSFNLNYHLSRTGNDRFDDLDTSFEPSKDVVTKHILGLSYNQSLLDGKMENVFFIKDYINHPNIRQTDQSSVTGSKDVQGSTTKNYLGYGAGLRYIIVEPLSIKVSYEHSVRLPIARELLGNGTTIYANVALKPENSNFREHPYYIVKDRKNEYYIDAADSLPRPLQLSEEEILKGVESIYTSQRDSSQHIPGIRISRLEHFETYYRDMSNMYRGRPQLPVWKITVDDPDRSVYYIHPETGIIRHTDTSSRWKYWSYTALHRMRLPGLNSNATLRKTVLWVLLLGGTAVCITGVALSVNYIRRKCCKRQKLY